MIYENPIGYQPYYNTALIAEMNAAILSEDQKSDQSLQDEEKVLEWEKKALDHILDYPH